MTPLPVKSVSFHCSNKATTHSSLRILSGTLSLKNLNVLKIENILSLSEAVLSNGLEKNNIMELINA